MTRIFLTLFAAIALAAAPAAAQTFVHDDAGMLSAATISQLNTRIGNFNAQTGKEIVVQTVPSVSGGDVRAAAESAFAQQQVNGVLIFVSKGDRKDYIVPDNAAARAGWWNSETSTSIAQAMQAQFRAGDFDGGITSAVNSALNVYRSHLGSLRNGNAAQPSSGGSSTYSRRGSTGGISMFWWIIIAIVGFMILRSVMRAASGPRYYGTPPAPGQPGAPAPGPGYGPGYGYGGYGGFGGGGGFWSGLLGGLGGAWLGNELFRGGGMGTGAWGNVDPTAGGGAAPSDGGGWTSDPGQAGMGAGGGGDWGGGGFGGGDFGGGGGGDFGGGFGGGDGGGGGSW